MPIYNGNYVAPVWLNGVPPTIGESELNVISRVLEKTQVLKGNGPPTTSTIGTVGQTYADMSQSPPAFYQLDEISGSTYVWSAEKKAERNLALPYSDSDTYDEGDYSIHEEILYKAKQDIDPAEAWNAAHWEQARAADEIGEHVANMSDPHDVTKAQIGLSNVTNDLQYSVENPAAPTATVALGGTWTSSSGVYTQTITVTGATVTSNSLVELQFTAAQAAALLDRNVAAIYVVNSGGTLTALAAGGRPEAMTVQCTVEETLPQSA